MHERIMTTPLNIDARGSSVRVVVAADKYTVANIAEGMNDRLAYAKLFAASPKMLEMLKRLADAYDEAIEVHIYDDDPIPPGCAAVALLNEARRMIELVERV